MEEDFEGEKWMGQFCASSLINYSTDFCLFFCFVSFEMDYVVYKIYMNKKNKQHLTELESNIYA